MHAATLCLCIKAGAQSSILLGFKKTGFGAGKLTGLGGKLEPGEKPSAAIQREVREESELVLAESDLQRVARLLFFFPSRPAWDHAVEVFTTRRWLGKPIETTEIKPLWFRIDRLPFD